MSILKRIAPPRSYFPNIVFIKPKMRWYGICESDDENTEKEDKVSEQLQEMIVPVSRNAKQVSIYVDCCDGRGYEDDVDVIRLEWKGRHMFVYSHRMDEIWNEKCNKLKSNEQQGLRWNAGAKGVDINNSKKLEIGESLSVAFWKIILVSRNRIEFSGITSVCAWIPPKEFKVKFDKNNEHVLLLDSPEPTICRDFKRCRPIKIWNRWDGVWAATAEPLLDEKVSNEVKEEKSKTSNNEYFRTSHKLYESGCLIWSPTMCEDGVAQTLNFDSPDVCFKYFDKQLPYSIRWGSQNEDIEFTAVKGYPKAVQLCVDKSEYIEDCEARSLESIETPKFCFKISPEYPCIICDANGKQNFELKKVPENILNDP